MGQMAALLSSCCRMPTTSQAAHRRTWSPMMWLDTWSKGADSHCCMAQAPGPYTSGGCRTPGHNPVSLLAAGGRRTPTQGHTRKNRGRARHPGAVSRYLDPQVWGEPVNAFTSNLEHLPQKPSNALDLSSLGPTPSASSIPFLASALRHGNLQGDDHSNIP